MSDDIKANALYEFVEVGKRGDKLKSLDRGWYSEIAITRLVEKEAVKFAAPELPGAADDPIAQYALELVLWSKARHSKHGSGRYEKQLAKGR